MIRNLFAILFLAIAVSSCKGPAPVSTSNTETVTVAGEFRSVQGVMDPLSCYASNGGYITQSNGERIAVSFTTEEAITCKSITVTGTYVTKTVKSEPNNPCPAGEMNVLEVKNYSCK